jgi:hypothetical protein
METRANRSPTEARETRLLATWSVPSDLATEHTREIIGSGDGPAAVLLRGTLRSSTGYSVWRTPGTNNRASPPNAC